MCLTELSPYTVVSNWDNPAPFIRLPRLPRKLIIVWKPPNRQTMSIDLVSMISTAFHHNSWSKVMHVVRIFSSVPWCFTYYSVEYIQLFRRFQINDWWHCYISRRQVCSDGYILNEVSPTTPQLISSIHLSVRMLKQVTASRNRKHIEELLLDKEFKLFSG